MHLLLLLLVLTSIANQSPAQKSSKALPAETSSRKGHLTLGAILACTGDSLIQNVFAMDLKTAYGMDHYVMMPLGYINDPSKLTADDISKLAKGFVTRPLDGDDRRFWIWVSDQSAKLENSPLPFCRSHVLAIYPEGDRQVRPSVLLLSTENWTFDPNEVLQHADQFKFESGVFFG